MPTLDSPAVTLGALYLAGSRRKTRKFTAGLSGRNLLAGGFGAASAEFIGEEVSSQLGMADTITPQLAQALSGAALARWGDPIPQSNAVASGILYNVAAQSMQDVGVDLGSLWNSSGLGGGSGSGGSTAAAPESVSTSRHGSMTNGNSFHDAGGVTFG